MMSLRQYAKQRGVSAMSVSLAVRSGRLAKSVTRDEHGQPKIADPDLADREWEANTDAEKRVNAAGGDPAAFEGPGTPGDGAVPADVATASARLKKWQADLAELKFKEAAGELIPVGEIRQEWADVLSAVRSKVLALPSRLRQQIPHLTSAEVALIDSAVRETLEDLARGEK